MAIPDISKLTLEELTTLIEQANKLRAEKVNARIAELDAEKAKLLSFTAAPKTPDTAKRNSPKVTHRGPNGETWTSRGQKPKWLQALIDTGHTADEFLVKE